MALAAVEAEVGLAHPRLAPRPYPDLHPQRVVAEPARAEARLLDQVNEALGGGVERRLSGVEALVELPVAELDGFLEQAILRIEGVEDRRRARARALGDVGDAGCEQPALVVDLGGCSH